MKHDETEIGQLEPQPLKPEEKEMARELATGIQPEEYSSVTEFGSGIQQEISEFAGHLLEKVRTRDSEQIGSTIQELVLKIKGVDVTKLQDSPGKIARLPWIGGWFDQVKKIRSQYERLESQIDFIQSQLNDAYVNLQKDTEMLDMLLHKNHSYFKQLDLHIAAIRLRIDELKSKDIPEMKQLAEKTNDPAHTQKANDWIDFAGRLEKKLDDFQRTRFLSLSLAPRIKLMQQGNQLIAEKIQSVTFNLIPLWKMELVTGLAQSRAKRSLELQKQVRESIEDSIRRNAEQMREVSADIARENEAGLVSMDTLKAVHEQLIATLEDTRSALEDGRRKRLEAERDMAQMEQELKRKVLEITGQS